MKNEMGWACGMYGERKGAYRVLMGKPEGKRPLGRPKYRWEYNTKNVSSRIKMEGMELI